MIHVEGCPPYSYQVRKGRRAALRVLVPITPNVLVSIWIQGSIFVIRSVKLVCLSLCLHCQKSVVCSCSMKKSQPRLGTYFSSFLTMYRAPNVEMVEYDDALWELDAA